MSEVAIQPRRPSASSMSVKPETSSRTFTFVPSCRMKRDLATSEDGELVTIKVDQVIRSEKTKVCGAENILYQCQSTINGREKRFELK